MITFSSDVADLILQRTLNDATTGLNKAINRMTTGYKINRAKDNAAGFSITTNLSTKISSMLQVQNNTEDGISLLATAEGGLEEIRGLLDRVRALTIQAANGNYDTQSRDAMQAEADALIEQIAQIRDSIQFNGKSLFYTDVNGVNERASGVTSRLAQAKPRFRAVAAPAAQSAAIEGAVDFAGSETKIVNIDGVNYEFKNRQTVAASISYSKDTATGEVTILSNKFDIRSQNDIEHKLKINGTNNTVYGGDLDDTITVVGGWNNNIYGGAGNDTLSDTASYNTTFWGNDGDDNITVRTTYTSVRGGAGDDTINAYGGGDCLYGEDGNDTLNSYAGICQLYGGEGNDILNFYSNENIAFGEGGNDIFNLGSTKNNTIDGGIGVNTVNGNTSNNNLINIDGFADDGIVLQGNESVDIEINGIKYNIKNNENVIKTLIYEVQADGMIKFSKANKITITGEKNKAHKVFFDSMYGNFYGGDLDDTIVINNQNTTVYTYGGDDKITIGNPAHCSKVFAGDGNDTIANQTQYLFGAQVYGEGGNDTFNFDLNTENISYNNYLNGGMGDDTFNVQVGNTNQLIIDGGAGNNTLNNTKSNIYRTGFSESIDNMTSVDFAANETKTIKINNIDYTIKNTQNFATSLLYNYNAVTGKITFGSYYFNITGQENSRHNVKIIGNYNSFYGGNLDDTISSYGIDNKLYGNDGDDNISITHGNVYGGNGNDTLTTLSIYTWLYGEDGDDTIILKYYNCYGFGGAGNDTFIIDEARTVEDTDGNNIFHINGNDLNISAGMGDDTFYIKGNNNIIMGSGGDDYFIIDGNNNTLDGGTGDNYYVNNGSGNTMTNLATDPNSGAITFSYLGEVKTCQINGKNYTFTNNLSDSNVLQFNVNKNTGVITFAGSDIKIDGASNEAHNLAIRGDNNIVNGGNLADRINVEAGSNNVINGGAGNDILLNNSENNSFDGGSGNDTITLNVSTNKNVTGGDGDDIININSDNNTQINGGSGNDKININGEFNTINTNGGNNIVTTNGNNNTIKTEDGDNKLIINSDSNTITAGNGANSIGINGNSNTIIAENAAGDINVLGNSNDITTLDGENDVKIKGNGNTFTTTQGDKKVEVLGNSNEVSTGSGMDKITIKGDNNTVSSGGEVDTFMVSTGNNNVIDGGDGRNTMINNGKNTTFTNVVDITPRPFDLELKVDIGNGADKVIKTSISFNLFDFAVDFSSQEAALESLEGIDDLIKTVDEQVLQIGSTINRLQYVMEAQAIKLENLISTRSTLKDADIAEESSNFIKYQILQQASATLMSSSRNIKASSVLGLLNASVS